MNNPAESKAAEFVLVPREPTAEMERAACRAEDAVWPTQEHTEGCWRAVYDAMLAAAPQHASANDEPVIVPREPSIEQLAEAAYRLKLVPRGEPVPVQFLDVMKLQYAAFVASAPTKPIGGEKDAEKLAAAIVEACTEAGIVDGTQPLTGPQMLLILGDLKGLALSRQRANGGQQSEADVGWRPSKAQLTAFADRHDLGTGLDLMEIVADARSMHLTQESGNG